MPRHAAQIELQKAHQARRTERSAQKHSSGGSHLLHCALTSATLRAYVWVAVLLRVVMMAVMFLLISKQQKQSKNISPNSLLTNTLNQVAGYHVSPHPLQKRRVVLVRNASRFQLGATPGNGDVWVVQMMMVQRFQKRCFGGPKR